MGGYSRQPLAKGKGVHCEVEPDYRQASSEGSWKQSTALGNTNRWYRRRLRMVIWKQWKRVKTRGKNLCKLGIPNGKSWEWANTRKGYWHVSNSFIAFRSITDERLSKAGYLTFSEYYLKV
jgi:hypothetical protein